MLKVALFAGLVLVSAGGLFLHEWSNRRRARRLLASRPALDSATFGRTYFGESEHRARIASEVRDILARHVPFGLEGLAPADHFARDLRMDELDSMSAVEFVLALEEHFHISIPDGDAEKILTVGQLVDYLDGRVRPGQGAGEQRAEADEARER